MRDCVLILQLMDKETDDEIFWCLGIQAWRRDNKFADEMKATNYNLD